jgi:predicted  nucleic acid-binding Zn-ribbon protein
LSPFAEIHATWAIVFESGRSLGSDASEILELENYVRKLKEERRLMEQQLRSSMSDTSRSARSDTSQRMIADLQAQIQSLIDDKEAIAKQLSGNDQLATPKSVMSDTSSRVIVELPQLSLKLHDYP